MEPAAIVLAGGATGGTPDALRPVDGGTALAVVLRTLAAVPLKAIVVVLGEGEAEIRSRIEAEGVRLVTPPPAPSGSRPPMIASIRAGLDALPEEASGALIWPVDRPLVSIRSVRALIEAHRGGAGIAVPVCSIPDEDAGRRGHPVLFARRLFDRLRAAPDEVGAVAVVRGEPSEVVEVPVGDRGVLVDVASQEAGALLEQMRGLARKLERRIEARAERAEGRRPGRGRRGRSGGPAPKGRRRR